MQNIGLLLLRISAAGIMISNHGLSKLMDYSQYVTQFPDPLGVGVKTSLGLAIFSELFCAGFVLIGLFSRLALLPIIITMLVAIFAIHGADPFAKKELAVLYLSMFTTLFLTGPGKYSVQEMFKISSQRFSWLLK